MKLTNEQRDELIEQYVELVVDNMDTKTLVQYVTDDLTECYENCSDVELREFIDNYDEELYDELVDNVTEEEVVYRGTANPNATNSEMDGYKIIYHNEEVTQ